MSLTAGLVCIAAATASDHAAFFEARVRPLLVKHCLECHSTTSSQEAGLVLDSRGGWEIGGQSGPAIIPGEVDQSLLIEVVRGRGDRPRMPPAGERVSLTDAEIADLERWIRDGAFDPRVGPDVPVRKTWEELFAERANWWSLLPLQAVPPPIVELPEWSQSLADRFLRNAQQRAGIEASPLADPETLLRRVSLVLTGLPPTPEERTAFLEQASRDFDAAYCSVVDRLLASPHFGERFARHWLDVVRFTETHGNEWNYDLPYAWRYRDYVIRAFQDDLPFDQFVREHIAGDLLDAPRWNCSGRFNESAIATAFFRCGEVNHDSCVQFPIIGYDIVDNQLDTLTKAFQAATIACARCHDHKADPFSTRDYHAILATLRSARSVQHTLDAPEVHRDALQALRELKRNLRAELARLWTSDVETIDATRLAALAAAQADPPLTIDSPLYAWSAASTETVPNFGERWQTRADEFTRVEAERSEFNRLQFTTLADCRDGIPPGWFHDGIGLRCQDNVSGDFVIAHEGDAALKVLLPRGVYTFAESDRLNGALRSPTLTRTHAKISFEVIGGRFSLARLVFNNCQLNYNHQHSIHHPDWSWITIDFPEKTDQLHPYAELLTYWDNPKFPDPLGTLGKDIENQRAPYAEHAQNPRTWWGLRRIVLHDGPETPRPELGWLARLYAAAAPATPDEAAQRYQQIARAAVDAFARQAATDDDVRWLDWFVKSGLLSNRTDRSETLAQGIAGYRKLENSLPLPTTMPGLADEGDAFPQPLLQRGDYHRPGDIIPVGYATVLTPADIAPLAAGSGRRELAELIVGPDNPLTARVMVNRIWQWSFGRGLVATPDDFGHLGEAPSHPELLDQLAQRFMAGGWSTKQLVREMVLSRAFRSASRPTLSAQQVDPENRLLSHYSARRAEAEVIRDSLLAVSGRLDRRLFGPSVHPFRDKADPEKRLFTGPLDGDGRRSLYLKVQLMEAPDFLSAFNLPGGKVAQGRRESSNTPAQPLALLNAPFLRAMAEAWAEQLVADQADALEARIDSMFARALGRAPTSPERERLLTTIQALAAERSVPADELLTCQPLWTDVAHLLFNLNEFLFIP